MVRGLGLSAVAPELDQHPLLGSSHLTLRDHLPHLPGAGPLSRTELWMLSFLSPQPRALCLRAVAQAGVSPEEGEGSCVRIAWAVLSTHTCSLRGTPKTGRGWTQTPRRPLLRGQEPGGHRRGEVPRR